MPKLWVKGLAVLFSHLENRLKLCHNTIATMQTGQSATTAAGQLALALQWWRGGDSWQSSGTEHAWGCTSPRSMGGERERRQNDKKWGQQRQSYAGRSQVPRPTVMSCHYPVNTATHFVSDQLGRHKGTGWNSAGGSDSLLVTSRPLSPSLSISFLFAQSDQSSKTNEWRWRGGRGGGDFILHPAKDVRQSLQQTRPSLDLWSSVLPLSVANTHTHTLKTWLQVAKTQPGWKHVCISQRIYCCRSTYILRETVCKKTASRPLSSYYTVDHIIMSVKQWKNERDSTVTPPLFTTPQA